MRLLLVEDDKLLGDGVRTGLTQEGYGVDWFCTAQPAELALQSESYAAMVLDIGLPDRSGLELLEALRRRGDELPVLLLTARDTVADRVAGLDCGADDYLVKPFDLDELAARLRALLRRNRGRAKNIIQHKDIQLDPAGHRVTLSGAAVDLSPREFAVLQLLLESCGKVISRRRLEETIYPWGNEVESNAIEVHIHHLRRKLGSDLIRTIRGVGYIIDPS